MERDHACHDSIHRTYPTGGAHRNPTDAAGGVHGMSTGDGGRTLGRRQVLRGLAATATTGVAGCLGDDNDGATTAAPLDHLPSVPEDATYSREFTGECVAGVSHYVGESTSLEGIIGPVYLAAGQRLIGIGYMFSDAQLDDGTAITPDGIEREFLGTGNLAVDYEIDHATVHYIEHGHVGFGEPHWDVHLWLISPELKEELALGPGSL